MKKLSFLLMAFFHISINGFTQEAAYPDLTELLKFKNEMSSKFYFQNEDVNITDKQRTTHKKASPADFGNPPDWAWTTTYGGSGSDIIREIAIAEDGSLFVTGSFSGEINISQNNYNSVGRRDAFLAKFQSNGILDWFQQFSPLPGEKVDAYDVHLDDDGQIYFTGYYTGDVRFGDFDLPGSHAKNLFLATTNASGQITMATNHNTFYPEEIGLKVDVDASGHIFVMCSSDGTTDFRHMTLVCKFSAEGNVLSETYHDQSFADMHIVGDNIYFAGTLNSSDYFGDTYLELEAYNDAFIAKSNTSLQFAWAKKPTHPAPFQGDSRAAAMFVSSEEEIYFTGDFRTNVTWGDWTVNGLGGYIAKCSADGVFLWATEVDMMNWEHPTDISGNGNELFVSSDYQGGANPTEKKQISIFTKDVGNLIFSKNMEFPVEKLNCNALTGKVYVSQDDNELMRLSELDASSLDTDWSKLFDGNSAEGYPIGMDVDHEEFIYNFGYASRPFDYFGHAVNRGLFLAKQWGAGGVKWIVQFANADPIGNYMGNYIIADTVSKNVYIGGRFYNPLAIPGGPILTSNTGEGSIFILKYDFEGNFQWAIQEDISNTDISLASDKSGNVLLTGTFSGSHTFGDTELVSAGLDDIFIVKYNTAGEQLWAQRAGGEDIEYFGLISTDGQDNVFLAGEFVSMDITVGDYFTSTEEGDGNIVLAKLDADGNAQWVSTKGGSTANAYGDHYGWPTGIHTDDGGYSTIKGCCYDSAHFDNIVLISQLDKPQNQKKWNKFVARFDPDGNTLWAKSISEVSRSWDYNQFDVDQAGNVYTGLRVIDTIMYENDYTYLPSGRYDLVTAKYTSSGELDWVKAIVSGNGGSDYLSSVVAYDQTTAFVGGWFTDYLDFGSAAYTVENKTGFIGLLGEPLAIPVYERDEELLAFDLFPNPARQAVNIHITDELTNDAELWITDMTGRKIVSRFVHSGDQNISVDLSALSAGVYFARLQSGTKTGVKKFVVE